MEALKLATAPSEEPVTKTELKLFLRLDSSSEDALLDRLISGATQVLEKFIRRRFVTQTWDLWLDCFPGRINFDRLPEGVTEGAITEFTSTKRWIEIPLTPLQSVTWVRTYDEDDQVATMPTTDYQVDANSEPGRVALRRGAVWPATVLRQAGGINIRFVCGYGAASAVPAAIKEAILRFAGYLYENRGCACDESSIPANVAAMLQPYRRFRL